MNYPVPNISNNKWESVKRIAHIMCEECGIDPDKRVHRPMVDAIPMWNNHVNNLTGERSMPQWESYIRVASEAYIGWKAVQRYMLVDA